MILFWLQLWHASMGTWRFIIYQTPLKLFLCWRIFCFLNSTLNLDVLLSPRSQLQAEGAKVEDSLQSVAHSLGCRVQTHTAAERGRVWEKGPAENQRKMEQQKKERETWRGIKKKLQESKSSEKKRLGNSTFHPSTTPSVRANGSLLVLASGSQAVRERSGKLQRDRTTARLSFRLKA